MALFTTTVMSTAYLYAHIYVNHNAPHNFMSLFVIRTFVTLAGCENNAIQFIWGHQGIGMYCAHT